MRLRFASYLIVGCIGAALGWSAHSALQARRTESATADNADSQRKEMPPAAVDQEVTDQPETTSQPATTESHVRESEEVSSRSHGEQPEAFSPRESAPLVLTPDHSVDALAMPTDRQTTSGKEAGDESPLPQLLNSMTIWCRFDPGNGAHLQGSDVSMYELTYQGGPISYDSINIESGTARMTGSAGATGSLEGVLDVLVTATRAGLHFSAFNSRGELSVTTVFGAVDKQGRYSAVMTTHGSHPFNGSYQTYGACDAGK